MDIDRYERLWIMLSAAVLLSLFLALVYSVYALDIRLVDDAGQVDPATAAQTPPFDEPGVYQEGPGRYRVVMVARAWSFQPAEVRVPAGSDVTFQVTSLDVIHGFRVPYTTINQMLIPGQVSEFRFRFAEPGEHYLFCHEYCGVGHHTMQGRIVVETAATGAR
ncbi:MAG: cupredoxin domain-containing protein [Firmicutes bacterium]|nr:cupredoxin domain-containing protein [Bacillota bacterium]